MRLLRAVRIYVGTDFSWSTSWRHAGDETVPTDAPPVRTVKKEDGFDYVEISPRPE